MKFAVVGYDRIDRVRWREDHAIHEVVAYNGARLVRQIIEIAVTGQAAVLPNGSLGIIDRGSSIELRDTMSGYHAVSKQEVCWQCQDSPTPEVEPIRKADCFVFLQEPIARIESEYRNYWMLVQRMLGAHPDATAIFMPLQIGPLVRNRYLDVGGHWGGKILLTNVQALREAGFRLREDGSTAAAVEDACAIIACPNDKEQMNMNYEDVGEGLRFFAKFDHIVVRVRADAVVYFDKPKATRKWDARLFIARESKRQEWLHQRDAVFGLDAVLAGAVARAVLPGFDFQGALRDGVARMNALIQRGYMNGTKKGGGNSDSEIGLGDSTVECFAGNPAEDLGRQLWNRTDVDGKKHVLPPLEINMNETSQRGRWDLFESTCTPKREWIKRVEDETRRKWWLGIASLIVGKGTENASFDKLDKSPYFQDVSIDAKGFPDAGTIPRVFTLGKLRSVDREEIDGLTGLWRLMDGYLRKPLRPLCIGVFGAPGGGKSFAVTEVANSVRRVVDGGNDKADGKDKALEFNVSQFVSLKDLTTAMHMVRDRYLETGRVPVAIFDEFDAPFDDNPFGWLQYFLMPMQDGKFKDEGQVFHTGNAIFIFCGGLNRTFSEFSGRQRDQSFCGAKGPDFISRLRGILNIPTLDAGDENDFSRVPKWMIRRAILLHKFLRDRNVRITDLPVMWAFLNVRFYRHGARSLEALIEMCSRQSSGEIDRTSLPRRDQLDLHTDAGMFWEEIRKRKQPRHTI